MERDDRELGVAVFAEKRGGRVMDRKQKIESLARAMCRAKGDDPDDKLLIGEPKRTAIGRLMVTRSLRTSRDGDCAMTRRILRKFNIDEISIVDRPAQLDAMALILKCDRGPEEEEMNEEIDFNKLDVAQLARALVASGKMPNNLRRLLMDEIEGLAAKRVETTMDDTDYSQVDLQGLAHVACELLAEEFRKADQTLTIEQAYSKAYESNLEIRKADRAGAVLNFQKYSGVARTEPIVEYGNSNNTGLAALEKLAAEFRRDNPFLTAEQAFARVYEDPANFELATAERAASRERLYAGGAVVVA